MTHESSLFEIRNERFPEPIDLTELPANRGFWTDHEMFEATGATSLLPIKNLQRRGLLTASKYKAEGKWHRAWTINDLVIIALTVDVAKHAGLSILDAIELLSLIPDEMRPSLSIDRLVDAVVEVFTKYVDPHGGVGEAEERTWVVSQPDTLSLIFLNRSAVYARKKGAAALIRRIGTLNNGSWERSPRNETFDELSQEYLNGRSESALELHLSRLGLSPIRTQFQLDIGIEFEVPK